MKRFLTLALIISACLLKAQYPFEKFPAIHYKAYGDWKVYDKLEKEKKIHCTMTIPGFFDEKDTLTLQFTSFAECNFENSLIRIFKNKQIVQKLYEDIIFDDLSLDSIRIADINGDSLDDIKIVSAYRGCGTASMNMRVIYLFQQKDKSFAKVSFMDKYFEHRTERDFDGDRNYEIIAMKLVHDNKHSYFSFNLFNYKEHELINVSDKADYPILIQFLFRNNYAVTDKMTRQQMKNYLDKKPEDYVRN